MVVGSTGTPIQSDAPELLRLIVSTWSVYLAEVSVFFWFGLHPRFLSTDLVMGSFFGLTKLCCALLFVMVLM